MTDQFAAARARGRRARSSLSADERNAGVDAAIAALLSLDELRSPSGSGRIALSRAIHDELDVAGAAPALRAAGWSVWLPAVVEDPAGLAFRQWRSGDELTRGAFGIDEPPIDGRRAVGAADLAVVVAPCVAVDERGTRVGFGAGYYDRALAGPPPRPLLVVAAFDVQVLNDPLPTRSWDVPAAIVVTDRRTIRTRR